MCTRLTRRTRRSARSLPRDETGASSLEFAILYIFLLSFLFMAVHFGLMFNAVLSVEDAAGEALESYTARDGGAAAAQQVVDQILGGDGTITEYAVVELSDSAGLATITISAKSVSVAGWLPLPKKIERTVTGPMEVFTTEVERSGATP